MKFLETFKVFFKNSEIKYRILDNGNTCSALRFEALEARELLSADAGLAIQETVSSVNSTEFVTTQETDDLIVDLSALTDKESFEGTSNSFFEEMIDDLMEPLDNENDDMSLQNAFEENSTVFDDVEIFSLNFETGQDRQSILDDSLYLSDEALSTTVLTYSLGGNSSGGSSSGGNSSGGNSSGGNSSGGNSSGGNSSGGNSSGGNSSGGNSSGGTDGHSYCFNKPIIEVDKLEQALASSGGSVSGGTAFPRMMLTSPNNLRVTITATDNDMVNGVDEQLRLVCTGLPCTLVETRRISGGYNFFVDIDISQSGRLNGSFTVVDKHNEASVPWVVDYTLVTINGFEWKERAPGESGYHDLVDPHVIWQRENENRIFFSTTPQIDYNNPAQVSAFLNLFNSQELYREWVWTGENYVQSNTWENVVVVWAFMI